MPPVETQEIVALALVFVVHVIGGLLLVWAMLDESTRSGWRRHWGLGGGGNPPPEPPAPSPAPPDVRGDLPLAAAEPSSVRLRGPGRLADVRRPAPRRPDHAPQPTRLPH